MLKAGLIVLVLVCCVFTATPSAQDRADGKAPHREVAITFDDLPAQRHNGEIEVVTRMTDKLVASIKANQVPAIGFVNEGKLYAQGGKLDAARVANLQKWLDAGFELGNHTYSHPYFYDMPLADFEANVTRGEVVTKKLLAAKGMKMRYFRHPFLNTGKDLATKTAFEKFLAEHAYTVAPVTLDNDDYIFAKAYEDALAKGDTATAKRIADAYVPYMEEVFAFYEKLSMDVLGYELPQILLVHAHQLNADRFDDLAAMIKRRGYNFVTLEHALKDKAYRQPDTFTSRKGISWLQRWAITKGGEFRKETPLPEFLRPPENASAGTLD
jgi:peptidoglycan/xylan/chitin deacetylase (PgdA/CDA1 family)